MVGSMIDITFRRKMEDKLKASEEKWRSLFENSPSIIMTVDSNYCITGVNRSISTRYDPLEIIGISSFELIDETDRPMAKENLDKVFSTGEASSFTVKRIPEGSNIQYYTVQAVPQKRIVLLRTLQLLLRILQKRFLLRRKKKKQMTCCTRWLLIFKPSGRRTYYDLTGDP